MHALYTGLDALLNWAVFASIGAGGALGIVVGILPGIGPGVAISVLLPFTFGMPPLVGISLLLGIYCGAFYGGAVTSILLRMPGEASSIMTMFDGHPMAKRGEAERALTLAFVSAFVGGIASAIFLAVAAPLLAGFAGSFGAAEYTCAALLAFICVARAYPGRFVQACLMLGVGLFAESVGIDTTSNEQRFTFGMVGLSSGFPVSSVVIGVFGMAQAFTLMCASSSLTSSTEIIRPAGFRWRSALEPFRYPATLWKSVGIGTLVGVLPAVGAALSTSLAYFEARRASRDRTSFGRGNPEGIVAAEAANNSNSGGAMITVLTLGIPGDAVTAIIMGVFIVHGVFPGPNLFAERPDLVNGIFFALLLINVVIVTLLVMFTRSLVLFTRADPRVLGVVILALCFIGAYSVNNSMMDIWVAFGFGIFGWLCALSGLPSVPLVLGYVLGDLLETSVRQALSISAGSFAIFVERPVSAVLLTASILMVVGPPIFEARARRNLGRAVEADSRDEEERG